VGSINGGGKKKYPHNDDWKITEKLMVGTEKFRMIKLKQTPWK
jgi:hypothetical protein